MDYSDPDWPPGTVKLQASHSGEKNVEAEIILQPRPTDNPNDPLNWPKWQKSSNYFLASFYAMMVYAFVNATSPTWGPLADELGFSDATSTNTYAIGCATLAVGAPMLIPFALKYGSRSVYVISSVAQFAVSIWAAKTETVGDWWGVNSVQCWIGALAEVLIQMTIADMYFVHQRGMMNSIYIWVSNVGSNLAVVAAGFITVDQGWRWVWWWCAIFFGFQIIMFFFGFEETKFTTSNTIQGRPVGEVAATQRAEVMEKSEQLSKEPAAHPADIESPADPDHMARRSLSVAHVNASIPRKTYWQKSALFETSPGPWSHFLRHSWQPFALSVSIPGISFCSLCYAISLAWSTVMTTALSTYMLDPPYNFTASQIGLMSLAPFIGSTLGSSVVGPASDYVILQLAKRNNGIYEPEMRFWVFSPFIPFQLAGTWWFAFASSEGKPWSQVAVAYASAQFGSAPMQSIASTYMLDAYNDVVADALTALTFARNLFSTIFVFAMPAWIAAVGIPNVFNTIGAIGIAIFSFSGVFIWRGKHFRYKTAKVYRFYAERQFSARPL